MTNQLKLKFSQISAFLFLISLGVLLAVLAEIPYGGWLQIPVLSVVWWLLIKMNLRSLKNCFAAGLIFGAGYFISALWWIYISLHDVGGMNAVLSCTAVVLLSSYMAIYFSIATLSISYFKINKLSGLVLSASWVLAEYLRGHIFTGFPWMGFSEAQVNGPFGAIAPYLGGLGCIFFTIWTSWQLLQVSKKPFFAFTGIVCLILGAHMLSYWHFTTPIGKPFSVKLIQGNFSPSFVFMPEGALQQIRFYSLNLSDTSADLIVAPETAFPWPTDNLPIETLNKLQQFANNTNSNLLFGAIGKQLNPSEVGEFSNRAIGLRPSAPAFVYDKSHLVPFGEFIPPGFNWFIKSFNVPLSNFSRGDKNQAPFQISLNGQLPINAVVTICYEDIFGDELATRIRNSSDEINLLINITNLAWFGMSQAPMQQLRLSQLRSLETGLPSLRSTNTGITAILGPDGKVLGQLNQFTQAILNQNLQAFTGKTLYVLWGNTPILTFSCLILLFGLYRNRYFL